MRVVVALGGTALARRGEPLDAEVQRQNITRAAGAIAAIARTHHVIVTHGSSPQVAMLAMQSDAYAGTKPYPLDMLGAESEGMIGYLIEQELRNQLPGKHVVTVLTQVEVHRNDPAFRRPSKPIGPLLDEATADRLANAHGWTINPEGTKWRRMVASPEPLRILELPAIKLLSDAGVLVVCAGGGGIPVAAQPKGGMRGVDAVIDKDLSAALLAHQLKADALLLLTDVEAVYENWGAKGAKPIGETTPIELRKTTFAASSMRPKVEAVCRFVESGGSFAAIGNLDDAGQILLGHRGTIVRRGESGLDFTDKISASGNIEFAPAGDSPKK
jgi:carbamate kinase